MHRTLRLTFGSLPENASVRPCMAIGRSESRPSLRRLTVCWNNLSLSANRNLRIPNGCDDTRPHPHTKQYKKQLKKKQMGRIFVFPFNVCVCSCVSENKKSEKKNSCVFYFFPTTKTQAQQKKIIDDCPTRLLGVFILFVSSPPAHPPPFPSPSSMDFFRIAMEKAKAGDPEAQNEVGLMYNDGKNLVQDHKQVIFLK